MKKVLFSAAAMLVVASAAFGAGADLSLVNCPGVAGAVGGEGGDPGCGGEPTITVLVTFSPNEAIPDLLGIDGFLEMQVSGGLDANNFWKVDAAGCGSSGLIGLNTRPSAGCANHTNTWSGGIGNAAAIQRGPNIQRIGIAAARGTPLNVAANQRLFGLQLQFNANGDLETNGCVGCSAAVAMVLNDITPASAGSPTTKLSTGSGFAAGISNCFGFNAGSANCQAVPARQRTWGQLKSLYR